MPGAYDLSPTSEEEPVIISLLKMREGVLEKMCNVPGVLKPFYIGTRVLP